MITGGRAISVLSEPMTQKNYVPTVQNIDLKASVNEKTLYNWARVARNFRGACLAKNGLKSCPKLRQSFYIYGR